MGPLLAALFTRPPSGKQFYPGGPSFSASAKNNARTAWASPPSGRPGWEVFIPGVKIEMQPRRVGSNKSLQKKRSDNRTGKRF